MRKCQVLKGIFVKNAKLCQNTIDKPLSLWNIYSAYCPERALYMREIKIMWYQRLKEMCQEIGISQKELAQRVGKDETYISLVFKGGD